MTTMKIPRLAIGAAGGVIGACCALFAFRNGQTIADGIDGLAFGAVFSAIVVGHWFLLPIASTLPPVPRWFMRIGWAACVGFVLINAVGFTASHRTENVGSRANSITGYQTALMSFTAAQERLTAMKANPRWQGTAGCTDATVPQSIAFCDTVKATQADVKAATPIITAGRPAVADAQAAALAWISRIDEAIVAKAIPIILGLFPDLIMSLFVYAALVERAPQPIKTVAKKKGEARRSHRASPAQAKAKPKPEPRKRRWTHAQTVTYLDRTLKKLRQAHKVDA